MTKTSFNRIRSRRSSLPLRFSGRTPPPASLPASEPSNLERITGFLVRKVTELVQNHGRTWVREQWGNLTHPRHHHHHGHRQHHNNPERQGSHPHTNTRLLEPIREGGEGQRETTAAPDHITTSGTKTKKTCCRPRAPPRKSYLRLLQEGPPPTSPPSSSSTSSSSSVEEVSLVVSGTPSPPLYGYPVQPMMMDHEGEQWETIEPFTLTTIHHHATAPSSSPSTFSFGVPSSTSYRPPTWDVINTPTKVAQAVSV